MSHSTTNVTSVVCDLCDTMGPWTPYPGGGMPAANAAARAAGWVQVIGGVKHVCPKCVQEIISGASNGGMPNAATDDAEKVRAVYLSSDDAEALMARVALCSIAVELRRRGTIRRGPGSDLDRVILNIAAQHVELVCGVAGAHAPDPRRTGQ